MFYSNVKKAFDFPSSNFFSKVFKSPTKEECFDDWKKNDAGRRSFQRSHSSLLPYKNHAHFRSAPHLSREPHVTPNTLPQILMASLHQHPLHQNIHMSNSEPLRNSQSDPSNRSVSEPAPSSPREGKRKRLQQETSSPKLIPTKQRKQSQAAKSSRHSLVIESPQVPLSCDRTSLNSEHTRSDSSSLHSSSSVECLSTVEPDDAARVRINHILNELITTEKTYMKDLLDILTGYKEPMEDDMNLFDLETVEAIFLNLHPIGTFHVNFLEKLDENKDDLDKLANCFLTKESEEGFSLYDEYCRKVPESLELIKDLLQRDETKRFIIDCQVQLQHFFPLSEFLHRPIQRVLKYPLLLRDLQKHTNGTRYAHVVDSALDSITRVAVRINKVKRVQELYSNELIGWQGEPLLDYGILKLEDYFKVNGSKDGRYLFLFDSLLLITKPLKDGNYHYKSHLLSTEIAMTEMVKGEPETKFELLNFNNKKHKFILQATDKDMKTTWVQEIKRCILLNRTDIPEDTKEVLIKSMPTTLDSANQFDNIMNSSKYKSLIPIRPSPDMIDSDIIVNEDDSIYETAAFSPVNHYKSPSPTYQSPTLTTHINNVCDDSGIEDPSVSKSTIDYTSLDVKAIKDRWIRQDKANSSTVPSRSFTPKRNSAAKIDTWPLNSDKPEIEELRKNNKVASMKESLMKSTTPEAGERPESPKSRNSEVQSPQSAKPCLARISHLQNQTPKVSTGYRDIKSLIEADAATSQQGYEVTSPDSNVLTDGAEPNLISGLDKHPVSEQPSNGSEEVFRPESRGFSNTLKSNMNTEKPEGKKCKDNTLDLSDTDEISVKIQKNVNISGTDTTKRNSFIIEKEITKNINLISPATSDTEQSSDTNDRVNDIKERYTKLAERQLQESLDLTDLIGMYDEEAERSRNFSPDDVDVMTESFNSLQTDGNPKPDGGIKRYGGRGPPKTAWESSSPEPADNDTLTRNKDTLTKHNACRTSYQGSSLVRRPTGTDLGTDTVLSEDGNIVMKPIRSEDLPPQSRRESTLRRTLSSDDDGDVMKPNRTPPSRHKKSTIVKGRVSATSGPSLQEKGPESHTLVRSRTTSSGLKKPAQITNIPRSDSSSSVRSRTSTAERGDTRNGPDRRSSNSTAPMGTYCRPTTTPTKKATIKTRSSSFNQSDNPFSTECKGISKSGSGALTAAAAKGSKPGPTSRTQGTTKTANAAKASSTTPQGARNSRSSSVCSDRDGVGSTSSERKAAYLEAISKNSTKRLADSPVLAESDPDLAELNSVRQSNLVAKMRSQLLTNSTGNTKITPTRSQTIKRRPARSHTTTVLPPRRSISTPAKLPTSYLRNDSAAPSASADTPSPRSVVSGGSNGVPPQLKNQKRAAKPRPPVSRSTPVKKKQTPPGTLKRGSRIPSPNSRPLPVSSANKRQVLASQKPGAKAGSTRSHSTHKMNKVKTSSSAASLSNSKAQSAPKISAAKAPGSTPTAKTPTATTKQAKPAVRHSGLAIKTPSRKNMVAAPLGASGASKPQQLLKINSVLDEKALRLARRDAAAKRQHRDRKFINGTSRTYSVV